MAEGKSTARETGIKDAPAWSDVLQIAKGVDIILTPEKAQALIRNRRDMINESERTRCESQVKYRTETQNIYTHVIAAPLSLCFHVEYQRRRIAA